MQRANHLWFLGFYIVIVTNCGVEDRHPRNALPMVTAENGAEENSVDSSNLDCFKGGHECIDNQVCSWNGDRYCCKDTWVGERVCYSDKECEPGICGRGSSERFYCTEPDVQPCLGLAKSSNLGNNAMIVSQHGVPEDLLTDQGFDVAITVRNTGSRTWAINGDHRLGSQNPRDNRTWGTGRIWITQEVPPGGTYTFNQTFKAPSTPGIYDFQWQIVEEHVEWFGEKSENIRIRVTHPIVVGVYTGKGSGLPDPAAASENSSLRQVELDEFVSASYANKKPAVYGSGFSWYKAENVHEPLYFPFEQYELPFLNDTRARGMIPMVMWLPWPSPTSGHIRTEEDFALWRKYSLPNIARGDFDEYIRYWVRAVRDYGGPVYVRLMHEGNSERVVCPIPGSSVPHPPQCKVGCVHPHGGTYIHGGCSPNYQCCNGQWLVRGSCGDCPCEELTGQIGCGSIKAGTPWTAKLFYGHEIINTPADQIAAWRRIVNISRQEHADNIIWVWSVLAWASTDYGHNNNVALSEVYPGDEHVDWIGFSLYEFDRQTQTTYRQYDELFANVYRETEDLGSKRPFMFAEIGAHDDRRNLATGKSEWIVRAFDLSTPNAFAYKFPKIRSFYWWNDTRNALGEDPTIHLAVHSSPEALSAFRNQMQYPQLISNVEENNKGLLHGTHP